MTPAPTGARDAVVRAATDLYTHVMTADPFGATIAGIRDFDHLVPDVSVAGEKARVAELDDVIGRVETITVGELDAATEVTRRTVLSYARAARAELLARPLEFTCAPFLVGPHARVLQWMPKVTLAATEHGEAYLERCAKVDTFLAQAAERLGDGVAAGRTPPARGVRASIAQLDDYLAAGIADDPLLTVTLPADVESAGAFPQRLRAVVEQTVRPALARLRNHLADVVLPAARPDEQSGVCWLPDGETVYDAEIRLHTTRDLPAAQIHQIGLDVVARLADEYSELGAAALGTTALPEIFTQLRSDRALRFTTSDEVQQAASDAVARAAAAVGEWFGMLPRAECIVRPIPAIESASAAIGYYQSPAVDGSRPGTYWVNTAEPQSRTRFECEALAFHESLPGHHLQVSLAQELDGLTDFQRLPLATAYVEGWALYTERLADEMGLYSNAYSRLGMLSFDSLRACRLVVDTGLHALGWSRQQAIDYCRANSPQALNNIDNEIDRYISMPGQALGYMIGRLTIDELRAGAQRRLGPAFDIRAFHDTVLGSGPVPLDVLRDNVERWTPRG